MDPYPSDSSNKLWVLPLLLLGVAASLLAVFWFAIQQNLDKSPGANPPPPAQRSGKFSRENSIKLMELRNHAIAHLENLEFADADSALSEIVRMVPTDPFGPRNLAICRQLALDKLDKLRDQETFDKVAISTKEAIERSIKAEPQSAVPLVIAARVDVKLDRTDEALKNLRKAHQLNSDSTGASYDLFTLLQSMPGEASDEEGFSALLDVFRHEPSNLFVIKDIVPMLAQRRDPSFARTLEEVQETISPFVEVIKINTKIDLDEIAKKAIAAAVDGEWPIVQRNSTIIKNLIIAEAARDKRFVLRDSLEYILFDFGETFYTLIDLPEPQPSASKPVHFVGPADPSVWPHGSGIRSAMVIDFDLHGTPDLLVLEDQSFGVWSRHSQESPWQAVTTIPTGGSYTGLLACDLDDDVDHDLATLAANIEQADAPSNTSNAQRIYHTADPDVILFGAGGLKLLENKKDPESDARILVATSGGTAFDGVRDVIAAAVADLDNDGDIDLIASTPSGIRVFSNRGNLTFEEITRRSMEAPKGDNITAFAIIDWDRDSDIDVLFATEHGVGWFENVRHGRLRYRDLDEFASLVGSTSLKVGDFDGDLSWDILGAGPAGATIIATHRSPTGLVKVRLQKKLESAAVRSAHLGDFDNDGALDIILLAEKGAQILVGDGQCHFQASTQIDDTLLKDVTSLQVADIDRDGDLDLVTLNPASTLVLSSQCRESDNPEHGFLEIQLVGYTVKPGEQNSDKRTNHFNLGGLVELKSGSQYQAQIVTDTVNHFGLGSSRHADLIRVLWTNGIPTNVIDPVPDKPIRIEQKLHGSCPYLYTWDGEKFVFVTDLLWNAPLGLKFAETVVAPWREWEYIKIDGDKLKGVNGEYQLRVTAELWEAEYFDQFKLFAIDHPEGTQIFTNEKVGPATIAEHKIHTVQQPRQPVAARDTKGHDVLDQVLHRDENYTKTFDRKLAQGFTEEHFLELDLGEFPSAQAVMLYLTGWMYPGSTSLSVQHSQNPNMPKPRPPALFVADGNGGWREALPFMGFPGGKTKTIAVDLSGLFPSDDHRLRIVSTMEIFWDCASFTVDDKPVEFTQTELTLRRAEVVDRGGVSFRWWPDSGNGPDQFDYQNLIPGEHWPAMFGNFTKYGDVLPLLTSRDDHLVVTGSGDEIRLGFAEPEASLQAGWVRDFVLYSVGWDKDADLNTVYGDTVEPMPFERMTEYAHRDGQPRPHDSSYEQYLREYQNRQRNPNHYWQNVKKWEQQRSQRN